MFFVFLLFQATLALVRDRPGMSETERLSDEQASQKAAVSLSRFLSLSLSFSHTHAHIHTLTSHACTHAWSVRSFILPSFSFGLSLVTLTPSPCVCLSVCLFVCLSVCLITLLLAHHFSPTPFLPVSGRARGAVKTKTRKNPGRKGA